MTVKHDSSQVEFTEEELVILAEILRFSVDFLPTREIGYQIPITKEKIEDLLAKIRKMRHKTSFDK